MKGELEWGYIEKKEAMLTALWDHCFQCLGFNLDGGDEHWRISIKWRIMKKLEVGSVVKNDHFFKIVVLDFVWIWKEEALYKRKLFNFVK